MSTYVMTVHPDVLASMFDNAKTRMMMHAERVPGAQPILDILQVRSGPDIAQARNTLVSTALQDPGCEWLLFLDSDMVFAKDLLDQLHAHANKTTAPIVGGLCFAGGHSGQITPVLKSLDAEGQLQTIWDYPARTLLPVDATGCACLLVHRTVYEAVARKYEVPFEITKAFGQPCSEDVTFCLRARSLDFPIHVHTGIKVTHMKMTPVDEEAYVHYRREISRLGEESYLLNHLKRLHLVDEDHDARDRQ